LVRGARDGDRLSSSGSGFGRGVSRRDRSRVRSRARRASGRRDGAGDRLLEPARRRERARAGLRGRLEGGREPHLGRIGAGARTGLRGDPLVLLRRRSEEHTLNSSHLGISYAVFCLKKKKKREKQNLRRDTNG